jgi:hypothetical protein
MGEVQALLDEADAAADVVRELVAAELSTDAFVMEDLVARSSEMTARSTAAADAENTE